METKITLQNFVSSKETKPDVLREACMRAGLDDVAEAVMDISAWIRAYHRLAVALIDKIRSEAREAGGNLARCDTGNIKLPLLGNGRNAR